MKELAVLGLSGRIKQGLGTKGVKAIANSSKLTALTTLNLGANPLRIHAVRALAKTELPELASVDISAISAHKGVKEAMSERWWSVPFTETWYRQINLDGSYL